MKKYFLTGILILLPFTLTLMVVVYLFDLFTTPFVGIVEYFVIAFEKSHGVAVAESEPFILFISRIIVLIFLFFLILTLGFFAQKFFFNTLIHLTNLLFSRIPFVKSVYKLSKDITKAMFSGDTKTFKKTVVVPFPAGDTHALAFITGEVPEGLKKVISDEHLSVFVPTAPHPMSGYILFTPKNQIIEVDVSTQEAFKFLVSCGATFPGEVEPEKKAPDAT